MIWIECSRAIVSTYHLLIHFLIKHGTREMRGDQVLARKCFIMTVQRNKPKKTLSIEGLDLRKDEDEAVY